MIDETVFARRASAILYNLALSRGHGRGHYLLPANVCPVVPLALIKAGCGFEFIDIDPDTLCMDDRLLQARIEASDLPPVAGIVYVRTYGFERDMTTLFRQLKTYAPETCLIDDRCASRPEPAKDSADRQGADVLLYSTGYSKYVDLDIGGFAHLKQDTPYNAHEGMFVPNDLNEITALYKVRISESKPIYQDGKLDETHPIRRHRNWLDTRPLDIPWDEYRLRILSERNKSDERKAAFNAVYRDIIPDHVRLPSGFHNWRFNIRVKGKEALLSRIRKAGFFAGDHYFPSALLFGGKRCPVSEKLYSEIINLFNDFRVTVYEVKEVAELVRDHVCRSRIRTTV